MPPRHPAPPTRQLPREEESKYTAFRCPTDLLELVKLKAKKDRRSLSNYVVKLIATDVEGMELPQKRPTGKSRSLIS